MAGLLTASRGGPPGAGAVLVPTVSRCQLELAASCARQAVKMLPPMMPNSEKRGRGGARQNFLMEGQERNTS